MTVDEKLEALKDQAAPRQSLEELGRMVSDLTARVAKIEKKLKA